MEAAAQLAHKVFVVLDRKLPAQLSQLSDKPEGALEFLTRPDQNLVGTIRSDDGNVDIFVERVDRGKSGSVWLFSRKTLEAIPSIYDEVNGLAVENVIPQFLIQTRIAGVALFEWLAILVGIPFFYLITALLNLLISQLVARIRWGVRKDHGARSTPDYLPVPIRLFLLALIIRWALSKVTLPLLARELWSGAASVIAIAAWVWLLILLNGVAESLLRRRLVRLNQSGATSILRLGRRAMDAFCLFAGLLLGLHRFGVNLTAALAGLGVGGIAIALAAQKTLENILGGISIVFDGVVRVGDHVKVGDNEGLVEDVGLRSTRIRTSRRTLVSIPNGQLANLSLENISIRDKFRFHHTLSLRLETPASTMRAILDGVNKLLAQHPRVESGSTRVRFLGFGASSLDVELSCYVVAKDWSDFLDTQQGLLLDSIEFVQTAGTQLAYPSQTLYLARSNGAGAGGGDTQQTTDKPAITEKKFGHD